MYPVHPNNSHFGGGPLPIKPIPSPLYVVTCISNPKRYRSRYDLYRKFEKYVQDSGAILVTIEQAFGEREFEITEPNNLNNIQVRTTSEIWHKENLLNLATQRLPSDWKYVAYVDADIEWARPDWVYESLHLLQHYDVIQMFSQAADLDPHYQVLNGLRQGIISAWREENCGPVVTIHHKRNGHSYGGYGAGNRHPGYAWAFRRDALNKLGGLIDWAIVGSADWHMASALVGQIDASISPAIRKACPIYYQWCHDWQERAVKYLKYNVGFMDGLVTHYWHGSKAARFYGDRWRILVDNKFNPLLDLKKDWQGVWQLTDHNHKLRDDLRAYFAARDEDSSHI